MENRKKVTLEIITDDGRVKVPVKNLNGDEIGVFYFNPTDAGIVSRYNAFVEKLPDIVSPLEKSDDTSYVDAIDKATKNLYAELDKVFAGSNASEAFFGCINPFSPCSGKFYFENVLNSVGDFIGQQFDEETKKINAKIKAYTNGLKR